MPAASESPTTATPLTGRGPWLLAGALVLGGGAGLAILDLSTMQGSLHAGVGVALGSLVFALFYAYQRSCLRNLLLFMIPPLMGLLGSTAAKAICQGRLTAATCLPNQVRAFTFANFFFPLLPVVVSWAVYEADYQYRQGRQRAASQPPHPQSPHDPWQNKP